MTVRKQVLYYLATTVLCAIFLILAMRLWRADINVPFVYSGDAHMAGLTIKNTMENGWYLSGSQLGGQFGFNSSDFPVAENIHYVLIKFIALFTNSYGAVLNIFFLLTFFLSAYAALFVFIKRGIDSILSIAFAILFAFLPYHFIRGVSHLFLSSYFAIPLVTYLLLSIMDGVDGPSYLMGSRKRIPWTNLFICLIVSSTGIYYAFFTCFFLVVAFIYRALLDQADKRRLSFRPILYISIICAGLIANVIPNILYMISEGRNSAVGARSPIEAEIYGLKMVNLFLPINGHRISLFSKIADKYLSHAILVNENASASLGIIGSIGFLISILLILFSRGFKKNEDVKNLGTLNLTAFLLATIGGFGSVFSSFVSPMIRAYNRISIFIGFFSLLVVLLLLDRLMPVVRGMKQYLVAIPVFFMILGFGLYDQTCNSYIPNYKYFGSEYQNDERFVRKMESTMPENALVFQLPYFPYPEHGPIKMMGDYDPLKGYLHSTKIIWSYGAIKGREGDLWMKETAALPIAKMVDKLRQNGYSGIYIDRDGYDPIDSQTLEISIIRVTGTTPILSDDERLVYISLK